MNQDSSIKIVDITNKPRYKRLLIGCIFHTNEKTLFKTLLKRRKSRVEYLKSAIPKGFHMKILFCNEDHIGMIEYGPSKVSGLPIKGKNIIVMNCIWVHTRAQGNNLGKMLMADMIKTKKHAVGFATIALEKYWMHWMQKRMMEKLGFKSIKSVRLRHKTHKSRRCFTVHLMWLPNIKNTTPPTFDESELLRGIDFCRCHPLYWGKYGCAKSGLRQIYEKC